MREIGARGPYRYTSNPLLVDKADIMQRREERTGAACTHPWHTAPSISTKLTFLSERSFSLKTFRGDTDGRVVFYKHSLFRTRFCSPLPSRALSPSLSPRFTPYSPFLPSLSSLFLESPRLTFPFLSVQRNDPEYLSIYASQFMSAHGLYSNHLLPCLFTRALPRRLSSLTFYIMLLTHVEVATFIEFHPEFIRDSCALRGNFNHVSIRILWSLLTCKIVYLVINVKLRCLMQNVGYDLFTMYTI